MRNSIDPVLVNEFGLTRELISKLEAWTSADSGIILASGKHSDSRIILNKLAPDWSHLSHAEFKEDSTQDKIFVYLQDTDPVSLYTSFIELHSEKGARTSISNKIKGIVSLIPLKKQCGACAKPTPIPQTSRSIFPAFLIPLVPTSYLFSRGCEQCEYRSYKGITFLESFACNLNSDFNSLAENLNPEDLFIRFRNSGMHIFYESGLEKINLGLTSLEQVNENAPPLEQAFDDLLNRKEFSNKFTSSLNDAKKNNSAKSILIVEDDNDQREILKLVFQKEGFEVSTAENGKIALEFLNSNPVQIILSDIMMPVMNGLQLVKAVKGSPLLKNIPVLMLTASSNPDHEVKLLEEGADDYCAKNVKKKVLLTRVEKLIEKNKSNKTTLDHFLT